jgi:opacity protein-like surface antigen
MKKLSLAAILAIGCMQNAYAQTADQAVAGSKDHMYDQYIGVQLNGLIRQVFNFNNSTTATGTAVNPYLLTYSINSKKTGWGLRAGIGYNYNSTTGSDDGGISTTVTKINDLQARLGVEKLFQLTGKWSAGAGLDLVYTTNNDHTTNTTNASGTDPGTVTDTKSVSSTYGGGPMGWLRYSVTKSVLIGTEASFYYVSGNSTNTISISDPTMANPVLSAPVSSNGKVGQGNFTSPVVFFITVKF